MVTLGKSQGKATAEIMSISLEHGISIRTALAPASDQSLHQLMHSSLYDN